jgi:hypothetical protein
MADPLTGNPLRSRADLQDAVLALCRPIEARFSPGGARVRLGDTAAHYDDTAAELEGFARPLWGLVPLTAGGGSYDGWARYRQGFAAGTDPRHQEYWGPVRDRDQRLVEMAAFGFALALAPEQVWTPLPPPVRKRLADWLYEVNRRQVADNNWLFFRVLVNLGLAAVGERHDPAGTSAALDRLDEFYLGDGWYADGLTAQRDYYVAFAMHFYGLSYAALAGDRDPQRADRYRERAAAFARDFAYWFAADGAALPFGRSLTYRFAQGSFWGALAFAGVDALPWGVVKGFALRHLRWWARQPMYAQDGTLTIGYTYPNLNMAEQYNSPGSPYWAMKFFLPLALPAGHAFWAAAEEPAPPLAPVRALPHAGMVMCRDGPGRHVFALTGGQQAAWVRHGAQRYAKFAYSTAFGFSVPSGGVGLTQAAADSMLALSDDGSHYRVREETVESTVDGDTVRAGWRPWPDVEVDTWLIAAPPWYLRIHRLRCERPLHSADGGFALDRGAVDPPSPAGELSEQAGLASVRGPAGGSGIRDLSGRRPGRVIRTDPNTNLVANRAAVPTLVDRHEPGTHWLACAVLGHPDPAGWARAWPKPPGLPDWTRAHIPPVTVRRAGGGWPTHPGIPGGSAAGVR